ncbi:hypothetical protein [Pseudodesulfovibrio tunisiensis]|uniref:hypothetical protein n=1 Tax=Pseudodesulfovibrio tunisiensis TaxID=463192 RepID=UPI001FB51395|nr:hypothetical protein [Pseudodesulfovibrio tunisiensis]
MYARVENGVVVEVVELSGDPAQLFTAEIAATWHLASEEVEQGWLWNGVEYSVPIGPEPPEPSYEEQRQAEILARHPVPQQLEALTEAAENPSRPDKLNALLADIQDIKVRYPKPEQA